MATQFKVDARNLSDRIERFKNQSLQKALDDDLEDIPLDKHSFMEGPTNPPHKIKESLTFAHLMLQLYDVLIEQIWINRESLSAENVKKIFNLTKKKGELIGVMKEYVHSDKRKKANKGDDYNDGATATPEKKRKVDLLCHKLEDLYVDWAQLQAMLESIVR